MARHDLTGDALADILVTSPWGIGLLSLSGATLIERMAAANGTRLGHWMLNTSDNNVEMKGDFDGDGVGEVLLSSPWGIGIVKAIESGLTSIAMAQNGTRHGGWIVNTADDQFLFSADFDGDGREEILVSSPWGIGLLRYDGGEITALALAANGTRLGDWLLNTADNSFVLAADADGDRRPEIVVTSPWGVGVLRFDAGALRSTVMAANGTSFGDWTLDTTQDRFEAAGHFSGFAAQQVLVRNRSAAAILQASEGTFSTVLVARTGDRLGDWRLDCESDNLGIVADFDGDGASEILVSSDWGIGILKLTDGELRSTATARNGSRIGGWLLNTHDNRTNYAADFDGDGRAEVFISSPWGIGILRQAGAGFDAVTMLANGNRIGSWLLNTADNDLEAGLGQSWGLIIYHSQWQGAVDSTTAFLRGRGYTVVATPNGADGIVALRRLALAAKAADRVFVYLAGHGGSDRPLGDTTKDLSLTHILQFEDGALVSYRDLAPWFSYLADHGTDVVVFDGSCDGGEAIMHAIGERYLALSTTSVYAPGITNTPDPAEVMKLYGKPSKLGLWWSRDKSASLLTPKTPHRFYQKIYRSDDTEINRWSLFYKPAITFYLAVGGGWDLMVRHCYLFKYIDPAGYAALTAAEKDLTTLGVEPYLTLMRADYNRYAPSIAQLRTILGNAALVGRAAEVYAQFYPQPWQTMFGDLGWNVDTDPVRLSPIKNEIEPRRYAGKSGFLAMVAEILRLLSLLESSYSTQESLLRQIDAAVARSRVFKRKITTKAIETPTSITDYLRQNDYDRRTAVQTLRILDGLEIDRARFFDVVRRVPEGVDDKLVFAKVVGTPLEHIQKNITLGRVGASVDELVAALQAVLVADSVYLDQLFYLLTIAEETISRAQSAGVETGELVSY